MNRRFALGRYLASLRSEFDDRSAPSSSGHGSSDAIRCIIWAVQLEFKVRSQNALRNWIAHAEITQGNELKVVCSKQEDKVG
jgi:hypothetical protein